MSDQTENNKVLIVGAGIGGLALAQGLRKHEIPYEIFERDSYQQSRKQGWAVALLEALNRLPELLPSDLGDIKSTSVNASLPEKAGDDIAFVDFETGETLGYMGKDNRGKSYLLRAGREHLRNFLWNHVPVSTGKQFSHYETTPSGVTVHFKDGSSATGSILIGADGASSHVRGQMLGPEHSTPEISNFIPIFSEVTLTREQYLPISSIGNAGYIGGNTEFRLAVGHRGFNPSSDTADYFLVACFYSPNPTKDSSWAQHATKQELFDKCKGYMSQLPSHLQYIMNLLSPENIITPPPRFLEFIPPSDMPHGRVSLLGDAAHAMTPFRGAGANTAVEDAADLARLIVQRHQQLAEGQDFSSWEDLLDRYNSIMTARGQRVVLASRNAGRTTLSKADLADRLVGVVPAPAAPKITPGHEAAMVGGRMMVATH